jgi:REP-associated tyrosine transposase
MARKPRVHFRGALYHVIVRGNKRRRVFRGEEDFKLYLRLLGEYKEVFDFVLCAYALMPTHVHLLVEVRDKPLSGFMQRLQFRYTRNYNIRYKTWGHLFQGRYKAILCEKDSYLVELSAYIHLNPVRAGLVQHPQEYRWTSYGLYLNGGKTGIVDVEPVLGQFSAHKGKAVRAYGQYVLAHIGDGHREEFYKVEDQRFLGSEGFADRIQRGAKEKVEHIYEISLEDLVDGVEMGFGIPVRVIRGMSRNRRGAWGRSIVGYLGRKLGGYPLRRIADYFRRDSVSLCQGIAKVERRIGEGSGFREKLTELEENLTEGHKRKIKK